MGGLRERPLCLSTPHTSCVYKRCISAYLPRSLPQHTSYELHLRSAAGGSGCRTLPQHTSYELHLGGAAAQFRVDPLPQHTSYELHPHALASLCRRGCFASAHLIRAASAKLHREMDAAL